jgi:hypothetical protein
MTDEPATPTHFCARCGIALYDNWPYAACEPCGKLPCPHGNPVGDCATCDRDGDFAFDAMREDRIFGRD